MANKWIEHVTAYAKKHGIKYGEAMKAAACKAEYKKGSEKGEKKEKKMMMKRNDTYKEAIEFIYRYKEKERLKTIYGIFAYQHYPKDIW